jgi:hypothetical protein
MGSILGFRSEPSRTLSSVSARRSPGPDREGRALEAFRIRVRMLCVGLAASSIIPRSCLFEGVLDVGAIIAWVFNDHEAGRRQQIGGDPRQHVQASSALRRFRRSARAVKAHDQRPIAEASSRSTS